MKRILLSAVMLSSIGAYAQQELPVKTEHAVGIETTEPRATLDVNGNVRVQSTTDSKIPSNENCPCFLVVDENGEVKRVPVSQGTGTSSGTTTGSDGATIIGGVSPVDGGVANPSVLTPDSVIELGWNTYQSNFNEVELSVNLPVGVPYSAYISPALELPTLDGSRKISIMYPKGEVKSNRKITATLLIDGDHTYAPKLRYTKEEEETHELPLYFNGVKQDAKLILHAGINAMKNREHDKDFLYPVVKIGDKYITAMNLGAEYAKEATTKPAVLKKWREKSDWQKDIKAYGSLFQWGRPADGHELINWKSYNQGEPRIKSGVQWKKDNQLSLTTGRQWVCPTGWHVPTQGEWSTIDTAIRNKVQGDSSAKNSAVYNDDATRFVFTGWRDNSNASFSYQGSGGYYWSSSESSSTHAYLVNFNSTSSSPSYNYGRAHGLAVRCLKD